MANKPTTGPVSKNIQLDYLYELLPPDSAAVFKVLWISDIELDLDYVEGKSTVCSDFACCHQKDDTLLDSEKASKYGSRNCYHSLDGYKRMIDAINSYNTSNAMNIKSIIYGGGGAAPVPEYMSDTRVKQANQEILKYLRAKNPVLGLYYALGPFDLYPPNYQLLSTSGNSKLTDYDNNVNTATTADTYTSLSSESTIRDKFKEYGYYSVDEKFIHSNVRDATYTDQAATAKTKSNLNVIFLNTNVCHNKNLALMREKDDPGGQLNYLTQ